MIIINSENLARHRELKAHFGQELAQRQYHNALQLNHIQLDPSSMQVNRAGVYSNDYWLEIDRAAAESAADIRGREIYDDMQSLATVLPLGKTVKAYTNTGDISNDVKVSMDGQAPFTFDHVGYGGDGDPIPMFTAGYGVNFRHLMGAESASLPIMIDSQRAKLEVFYANTNNYLLNGHANISEASFKGEGLKNHRNTAKVNLGAAGANIDLTAAATTNDAIINFFTVTLRGVLDANNIPAIDKFWVSKEIAARMAQPFSASTGFKEGTLMENVLRVAPFIKEIGTAYTTDRIAAENAAGGIVNGLSGNEFLAYVKSKSFIEIPTGQAVQIVPLPRLMPRANFNNDISTAFGVQVKKSRGNSGVFYGAEFS